MKQKAPTKKAVKPVAKVKNPKIIGVSRVKNDTVTDLKKELTARIDAVVATANKNLGQYAYDSRATKEILLAMDNGFLKFKSETAMELVSLKDAIAEIKSAMETAKPELISDQSKLVTQGDIDLIVIETGKFNASILERLSALETKRPRKEKLPVIAQEPEPAPVPVARPTPPPFRKPATE